MINERLFVKGVSMIVKENVWAKLQRNPYSVVVETVWREAGAWRGK